jgi:hypothetical protein
MIRVDEVDKMKELLMAECWKGCLAAGLVDAFGGKLK